MLRIRRVFLLKIRLPVCFFLLLNSCSHIQVVEFDKQNSTVSIQGGKWDSEQDVQNAARNYCGGPVKLLTMGQKTVGTYTSASGGTGYASATTVGINRNIYTYSCSAH